jgi:hypothetical protein
MNRETTALHASFIRIKKWKFLTYFIFSQLPFVFKESDVVKERAPEE